jgi:hypothetical protein
MKQTIGLTESVFLMERAKQRADELMLKNNLVEYLARLQDQKFWEWFIISKLQGMVNDGDGEIH